MFLRPTLGKIILTIVLLVVSSMLWQMWVVSHISDTFPMGFPLQFYVAWGPCPAGVNCSESNGVFLILDILIWYGISAFVLDRVGRTMNSHA